MPDQTSVQRTMGLAGALGVGIGAIVGGGILALAGVAFSTTGPAAIVAFALNGVIALLTAVSIAEMSATFPESGGAYTFAKKVLNVRVAFGIGWVVWFASLVAAVLYALGFGAFLIMSVQEVVARFSGDVPAWLTSRWTATGAAAVVTLGFTHGLQSRSGGGGPWINIAKSAVFAVVIAGGLWAVTRDGPAEFVPKLSPFFSGGLIGLFQAMGFTFIALQGFDLIAAVAGEIKDPGRNIPRAMIGSLAIALAIYLPLLFIVAAAGVDKGEFIADMARAQPEIVVAVAAKRFLGDFGYWLVMVAGLLSMASALHANLFAASRVSFAMGRDRTLTPALGRMHAGSGTPRRSVRTVAALVVVIIVLLPDVATAGAASSLIFLITFALTHFINILLRRRISDSAMPFRVPWFPLVPLLGGTACLALAVFQGISVPLAGGITLLWLVIGGALYAFRFAGRAKTFDAGAEAEDPQLVKTRGRNPLVLLPVDDDVNAVALVGVAHAICPPAVGRVLLLAAVKRPATWHRAEPPPALQNMSAFLRDAVNESFSAGLAPEAMLTVADNHWNEVARVARLHQCESMLLGFRSMDEQVREPGFNELVTGAACDVVLLRVPQGWNLLDTRRILIPLGGRGMHSPLRARLLGTLRRHADVRAVYAHFASRSARHEELRRVERYVKMRAEDELAGDAEILVKPCDDPAEELIRLAGDADLIILGLQQTRDRKRALSDFVLRIAGETTCAVMILGQKRGPDPLGTYRRKPAPPGPSLFVDDLGNRVSG